NDDTKVEIGVMWGADEELWTEARHTGSTSYFIPYRTVLLTLAEGVPESIAWDDRIGCDFCGDTDASCIDNVCGLAYSDYTVGTDSICNTSFMLAWEGTDSDGEALTSEGSTFYNYRYLSLSDAEDLIEDIKADIA
ncbi:hypothetical protein KIPB_008044, partial [Kipferlia bialata]